MINLTHPELAELTTTSLPPASSEALDTLRTQACQASQGNFSLTTSQKFLRRVMSPDSPSRGVLLVHGTGVGKTCTAIQVAEEYILRPEFQDKKVMVIASSAVQDNFRTQIFDMSRVNIDLSAGTLDSKQCTGRRYLDMLLRIESEPKNWTNPEIVGRLQTTADRIIKEFYQFSGYNSFGELLRSNITDEAWVHENFDNRLLIIDEAHRITPEAGIAESDKAITEGLEKLVKVAKGLVIVLLTATPMFDTYESIMYYMNLFLWNDRMLDFGRTLTADEFFNSDITLKSDKEGEFRAWCQRYISYVKGESPFSFPFRLPPPEIARNDVNTRSFTGERIDRKNRLRYLSLVASYATGLQKDTLTKSKNEGEEQRSAMMQPTVSVLPDNKSFNEVFRLSGSQYEYTTDPFLTPDQLPNHSSKFVSVLKSIESSSGVVLVYSNYVSHGAKLFAMALEEHGYKPYKGDTILASPSHSGGSKGTYALITSGASNSEISAMLKAVKNKNNKTGRRIKVIVTSPIASEGVDFRFIRQVHIMDPWWNMSRIEQVVGRALRTCSHQALPPEEQNCSVYLHVVRVDDKRECYDEYTYRTKVEYKGVRIAKVRKILAESAMDCPLQLALPADWKELVVPQIRDEGHETVSYTLGQMMAPTFDESPEVETCKVNPGVDDPRHVRPLSSYLDARDEILAKVGKLFVDKPIWDHDQLIVALQPHSRDVVIYTLQNAISSAFRFSDSFGRPSLLESKGDLYALAPIGVPNSTMVERTTKAVEGNEVPLPEPTEVPVAPVEIEDTILDTKRDAFSWPRGVTDRFDKSVLNGYIVDHAFTHEERSAFFATNPDLPFLDRIRVDDGMFATGAGPGDLVGEELTKYTKWNDELIDRFLANKNTLFASLAANRALTLCALQDEGDRVVRLKPSYKPIVAGTGKNSIARVTAFAKTVDKNSAGVPVGIRGPDFMVYVELLAREENNCVWYTPEEMSTILLDSNKAKIKAAIKEK